MYPRCKRHQGIEAVLLTQIILFTKKLTKLVESSTDEEKDGGHDEDFNEADFHDNGQIIYKIIDLFYRVLKIYKFK